jgi:hypothetical protein
MNDEAVLEGTLHEDGSLHLDEKPNLPPGRVRVVVQSVPYADPPESIIAVVHKIWEAQRRRGHVPRLKDQIDAELSEMRDEWEEHQLAIEKLQEECQKPLEPPSC